MPVFVLVFSCLFWTRFIGGSFLRSPRNIFSSVFSTSSRSLSSGGFTTTSTTSADDLERLTKLFQEGATNEFVVQEIIDVAPQWLENVMLDYAETTAYYPSSTILRLIKPHVSDEFYFGLYMVRSLLPRETEQLFNMVEVMFDGLPDGTAGFIRSRYMKKIPNAHIFFFQPDLKSILESYDNGLGPPEIEEDLILRRFPDWMAAMSNVANTEDFDSTISTIWKNALDDICTLINQERFIKFVESRITGHRMIGHHVSGGDYGEAFLALAAVLNVDEETFEDLVTKCKHKPSKKQLEHLRFILTLQSFTD